MMMDIQARLDEIDELGLTRRMRLVSGPQGPRVVLDGKPVCGIEFTSTDPGTAFDIQRFVQLVLQGSATK